MSLEIKEKAVLVTGASGAIGQATCEVLRESGYHVVGMDKKKGVNKSTDAFIHMDLLEVVRSEIVRNNFKATLTDVLGEFRLYGLVNNAALQIVSKFEDLEVEQLHQSLDVNFIAPFILTRIAQQLMGNQGGAIVNVGSIHSSLTKPYFTAYSTSKHALDGLTRALSLELCEKNIRVNTIMPAATNTKMLRDGFAKNGLKVDVLEKCHPLGRIAEPVEVGVAIKFLLSEDSAFITGTSLKIDGGIGVRLHDPE